MPESMTEMLARDLECENLLECFHGLNDLDRKVFELLATAEDPLTVDEIAAEIDRERTSAYRSVQRLREAGVVRQRKRTFDSGSYCHVFEPADPDEVADEMRRLLNDWYATMGQLIAEFRQRYGEELADPSPSSSADD